MQGKRIFTDEELEGFERDQLQEVKDLILAGRPGDAIRALDDLYENLSFLHDASACWIASLLTHIYREYGLEALKEAELDAHRMEGSLHMKPPESNDIDTVVRHTVKMMRGHVQQGISVEEDDEKVIITVRPCGSGNRMVGHQWYGEGKLACVHEASDITWGIEDFPIYCVHCPIQEMLEVERMGVLKFVHNVDVTAGPGETQCQYLIYKDPQNIPEMYYKRIGHEKPE